MQIAGVFVESDTARFEVDFAAALKADTPTCAFVGAALVKLMFDS